MGVVKRRKWNMTNPVRRYRSAQRTLNRFAEEVKIWTVIAGWSLVAGLLFVSALKQGH
jgi:hypothetical protein